MTPEAGLRFENLLASQLLVYRKPLFAPSVLRFRRFCQELGMP